MPMIHSTDTSTSPFDPWGDALISETSWIRLTRDTAKRDFFHDEFYFRESMVDLCATAPDANTWAAGIERTALLIVRPDTIATRQTDTVLSILRDNDFRCVAASVITLDRLMARSLWYYTWNQLTVYRSLVADRLNDIGPSLLLLMHDVRAHDQLFGCMRLARLKGPSLRESREPNHIRHRIGCRNEIFCGIHTADEPVDVIRELGILLSRDERRDVFGRMMRNISKGREDDRVPELVRSVEAAHPYNPLDWKLSCDRLENAIADLVDVKDRTIAAELLKCLRQRQGADADSIYFILGALTGRAQMMDILYVLSDNIATTRGMTVGRLASATWRKWLHLPP